MPTPIPDGFVDWAIERDFIESESELELLSETATASLVQAFEREETERLRDSRPRPGMPAGAGNTMSRDVLAASIMLRAGNEGLAVRTYGERAVEAARKSRIHSLVDVCEAAIRMEPGNAYMQADSRDEMVKLAFSTIGLPNILSNVMGKTLEDAYMEATSDIRLFATVKSAADFKDQRAIRPSSINTAEKIAADGKIPHSNIAEEDTYNWRVDTFARMVGITRQDIVNDDLSFFDTIPVALATAAARALLDLFYGTIIANAGDHFHTTNGNLLTSGSALGTTSLSTAVQTFREQVDSRGNNVSIRPRVLVVSPHNEFTARTLLNSAEIRNTTSNTTFVTGNPVQGIVDNLVVEARLGNDDKFPSTDEKHWYLFGGPSSSAVLLGFLDGRQRPVVETEAAPFNTLGQQFRVYHDFGVALADPRAGLKATGEN